EARRDRPFDLEAPLPVPELANVEVPGHAVRTFKRLMAQENVACCLHQVLAGHHPRPVAGVTALADELLEHGCLRLFGLEEQRVLVPQSHQQQDPGPGTHAPYPHDLAGDVHELELLEEVATIGLEASPIPAQELVEGITDRVAHLLGEQVLDGYDERRIAHDA